MAQDLISINEAASILGISASHFHYYFKRNRLPPHEMISGHAHFNRHDIQNLKLDDIKVNRWKKPKAS